MPFDLLGLTNNGIDASPNGQFDFGVSTGGSFEGSGPPNLGDPAGDGFFIDFVLTGSG